MKSKEEQMFLSKVIKTKDCWKWTGLVRKDGAAQFTVNHRAIRATNFFIRTCQRPHSGRAYRKEEVS